MFLSNKSLDMLIDENLPWENYVDALSKKIASGIGTIKHIIVCLLPPCMMYNYYGLVQLHFYYCSMVWGNCGNYVS